MPFNNNDEILLNVIKDKGSRHHYFSFFIHQKQMLSLLPNNKHVIIIKNQFYLNNRRCKNIDLKILIIQTLLQLYSRFKNFFLYFVSPIEFFVPKN